MGLGSWGVFRNHPPWQAGDVDDVTDGRVEIIFCQAPSFSKYLWSIYLTSDSKGDDEDTEIIRHHPHFGGAQS